jgi:hypothetical protein
VSLRVGEDVRAADRVRLGLFRLLKRNERATKRNDVNESVNETQKRRNECKRL